MNNAKKEMIVCCPPVGMPLTHPRVYLVTKPQEPTRCPYCSQIFHTKEMI